MILEIDADWTVPRSIGIETKNGIVPKIIRRGTSVPCIATTTLLASAGQKVIKIKIFEGEQISLENYGYHTVLKKLWETKFELENVDGGKNDVEIEVTIKINKVYFMSVIVKQKDAKNVQEYDHIDYDYFSEHVERTEKEEEQLVDIQKLLFWREYRLAENALKQWRELCEKVEGPEKDILVREVDIAWKKLHKPATLSRNEIREVMARAQEQLAKSELKSVLS
ncbi:unnamed protein product [Caenorhabditis auriculariae]|uniref:Uncharacterized protein n=1 Tax=Caenorhabditis auriculariae TaxID=2777116 RepID=A0A8S1H4D8_9PELO|nr:unnamed protein product [Caenorhabditis auriculariae]